MREIGSLLNKDFSANGVMIAGIRGQAVGFDPGGLQKFPLETKREDVVNSLAGMLRAESSRRLTCTRIARVKRIEIPFIQQPLHDAAGELIAVLPVFLLGRLFACGDVDPLYGRICIEIAP